MKLIFNIKHHPTGQANKRQSIRTKSNNPADEGKQLYQYLYLKFLKISSYMKIRVQTQYTPEKNPTNHMVLLQIKTYGRPLSLQVHNGFIIKSHFHEIKVSCIQIVISLLTGKITQSYSEICTQHNQYQDFLSFNWKFCLLSSKFISTLEILQ